MSLMTHVRLLIREPSVSSVIDSAVRLSIATRIARVLFIVNQLQPDPILRVADTRSSRAK